jgi:hypothetical protein
MKGVVFTEFLEMVEDKFGFETADAIVMDSNLPSGGVYTSIGTYDHQEMITLLHHLNERTQIPISDLLRNYGQHLFIRFTDLYPVFFKHAHTAFDFLESVENHIHTEVLKLYPDAELPKFETHRRTENLLEMVYTSDRMMGHFAHGLIKGCLDYFKEDAEIKIHYLDESGKQIQFEIVKVNE